MIAAIALVLSCSAIVLVFAGMLRSSAARDRLEGKILAELLSEVATADPDDTLVLETERELRPEALAQISEQIRRIHAGGEPNVALLTGIRVGAVLRAPRYAVAKREEP